MMGSGLELKRLGEWRPVDDFYWNLKSLTAVCECLDCGSVVSINTTSESSGRAVWRVNPRCSEPLSDLKNCFRSSVSSSSINLRCSDGVRLLNGSSRCSGRLQVKTNPSDQTWSSVCEADLDLQDAQVVCRELGCGAPSVLQGALYGDVQTPRWSPEFQCGGHESALLDCRSSGSARSSCSPGKAAGLTCSGDEVRLVGGASRCAGSLELKVLGEQRPVAGDGFSLKTAALICEHLNCGSAVSAQPTDVSYQSMWIINSDCVQSGSDLWSCVSPWSSSDTLKLTCSDRVRLLNGSSRCSGRLQVKTDPSDQTWSSVCEADLDLQDAQVVCRELGCGAPSVLQGALYGDVQTPRWSPEFQCGGHESALLDCRSSGSARSSCSPGKAAGLTCSGDEFRLVGGASRCAGSLELKVLGDQRPVAGYGFTLKRAALICEHLNCGSALSVQETDVSYQSMWGIHSECVQSESDLWSCVSPWSSSDTMKLTCSDGVRLLNGSSRCSGRDPTAVVVRWVVVPLSLLLLQGALWLYCKASRGQTGRPGGR
ncbi:scavenger receptor cysteine-rich type 1 protein M130-like [Salarias fasciatus]|uniref:scavenger receptor cysteine-rich type 1 protein M130-like n=1 Tax=Salarias fasciatus TaxID=181472 RepID=UPI0011767027|nr:scavenger receptor cysteine-rich type 1 protein M130-like [Salarias fasciatus]